MLVFVFICPKHYYWVWDRLSWCLVSRIAGRTLWDVSVQVSNGPPDIRPSSKIDIIISIGFQINLNASIQSQSAILRIDISIVRASSFSFENFMRNWQILQVIAKADPCLTLSVMFWVIYPYPLVFLSSLNQPSILCSRIYFIFSLYLYYDYLCPFESSGISKHSKSKKST